VNFHRAVDVLRLDGTVARLGDERSLESANFDVSVGRFQARRPDAAIRTDRTIGGDQMIQHRRARHFDREPRAVIPVAHTRPHRADRYGRR